MLGWTIYCFSDSSPFSSSSMTDYVLQLSTWMHVSICQKICFICCEPGPWQCVSNKCCQKKQSIRPHGCVRPSHQHQPASTNPWINQAQATLWSTQQHATHIRSIHQTNSQKSYLKRLLQRLAPLWWEFTKFPVRFSWWQNVHFEVWRDVFQRR